ncbi:uncharacterized protein LOC134180120 [Corticium candelabrum]|uniref:uncharacterized protein LOC134180120 n=1 Tax=Corticium candelabrum TaxID=121492 RepID=UPI002E257683|nr:uncharacterized protein LOC134180120 [Corticium candelabrum]
MMDDTKENEVDWQEKKEKTPRGLRTPINCISSVFCDFILATKVSLRVLFFCVLIFICLGAVAIKCEKDVVLQDVVLEDIVKMWKTATTDDAPSNHPEMRNAGPTTLRLAWSHDVVPSMVDTIQRHVSRRGFKHKSKKCNQSLSIDIIQL